MARRDRAAGEFYSGSADWMLRDLSLRIEIVRSVWAESLEERLWEVLDIGPANTTAWRGS